ncbi:hypothetical protein [Flagellimonas sp.]|uniref:hypothetical protein n=1 Tax=Flagellimonas sp. TaxID=2058762 RepID=UPI003BAB031A
MVKKIFPSRFSIINAFALLFLIVSFVVRSIFLAMDFSQVEHSFFGLVKVFMIGLFFDIGALSFFYTVAALYFMLLPEKFHGSVVDRIICYLGWSLGLLIVYFSFFAEITFWDEFQRRFNFIAVDYLIYTYEVVKNINESYPLPLLIGGMLLLVVLTTWYVNKKGVFRKAFRSTTTFRQKTGTRIPTVYQKEHFPYTNRIPSTGDRQERPYTNRIPTCGLSSSLSFCTFAGFGNSSKQSDLEAMVYKAIWYEAPNDLPLSFEHVSFGADDPLLIKFAGSCFEE